MSTYPEVISYLESFVNYERCGNFIYKTLFKLNRVKSFLNLLNNPQDDLRVIHIAGTKGKGSVCAFIAYILRQDGFKVGLYTSPHLVDFRERIRILDKAMGDGRWAMGDFEGMIPEKEVCSLVDKFKPVIEKFHKKFQYGKLTFFEVYTAMAFQYFKEKKVDFVVLETGLGGRLDATNVCFSLVSVVTPISYEHTASLGKTLTKIAYEKACIIKKENKIASNGKRIALTSKQPREVLKVIKKFAKKNNALLLKGKGNFKINLLGQHQKENAGLAVVAVEALRYYNIKVGKKAFREGLKKCRWPARFEIVSKRPLIVLDGAQNAASVKVLARTVKQNFPKKKVWIIFGISKDKELKDTCREIEKISKNIILTKSVNPRAAEPKDLLRYFRNNPSHLEGGLGLILSLTKQKAARDDLILVTGSLYLCGEARKLYVK